MAKALESKAAIQKQSLNHLGMNHPEDLSQVPIHLTFPSIKCFERLTPERRMSFASPTIGEVMLLTEYSLLLLTEGKPPRNAAYTQAHTNTHTYIHVVIFRVAVTPVRKLIKLAIMCASL